MKTKLYLYVLWSVLSAGLLICAADTHESPFTRRKRVFKLGRSSSKPVNLSTTGGRKSSHIAPSLSELRPGTPRAVRPGEPRERLQSDFASLPDVSLTCSASDFVVRVKPAFYGLGAAAEELRLGNTCRSNGVLRPYGDLLFTYPLTACEAVRQAPRGYLVYNYVLHYEPSPERFPGGAHRIDVDIECRYPRNHHVHQLTVRPTWRTAVVRKRLNGRSNDFQVQLMDDSWSRPVKSRVYQLGNKMNFQVSALHPPTGGKLYISSCYASPLFGSNSSLKYTIIDNYGCLLDSKRGLGASQFVSRTDRSLRFSLRAFQFTSDPETEVSVHCKLFVTSEDPGPAHKSCTYRGNRWTALTGDHSVCECCDSRCVTSKPRRAMMEGSSSSRSLLVSDQPYMAEDGFLPISPTSVSLSREGEATIIHDTDDLQGSLEESKYEEEEQLDGEESGMMQEEKNESAASDSTRLGEDGSGDLSQEDFSESEEEQVMRLRLKEVKVLSEVGLQEELQPVVSEEERSEEDDAMKTSEVKWKEDDDDDDHEMTWYFWR